MSWVGETIHHFSILIMRIGMFNMGWYVCVWSEVPRFEYAWCGMRVVSDGALFRSMVAYGDGFYG